MQTAVANVPVKTKYVFTQKEQVCYRLLCTHASVLDVFCVLVRWIHH